MLPSLEIREFRTFRHLRIERLGRVNLIVGKNNVGKTTLLEALWLYAYQGATWVLHRLLLARDEFRRDFVAPVGLGNRARSTGDDLLADVAFDKLFYGRKALRWDAAPIRIGPVDSEDDTLTIAVFSYRESIGAEGYRWDLRDPKETSGADNGRPALKVQFAQLPAVPVLLDTPVVYSSDVLRMRYERALQTEASCVYVSAEGLNPSQIGRLWDSIALTPREEDLLSGLRIITPEVERISLVGEPERDRERRFVAKISGLSEPVPLRSLGDGMNRLLGIMLALVNAKNGILLVDEIENGLHYSVQPEIWSLIFQVADRLNVQVFATSHSWDSVEAFQIAASANKQVTAEVIRLEYKMEKLRAVLFDEEDLNIVTREQIEVR